MSDLSKLGKDEAFSKSTFRPIHQSKSGRAEHHGERMERPALLFRKGTQTFTGKWGFCLLDVAH